MKHDSEIVELNVGGSLYTTTRTTLTSCPNSMLARMLDGPIPVACDQQGRVFIDRDGLLFRHILNFLRNKQLSLPDSFTDYVQLHSEADFYGIEEILNILRITFPDKFKHTNSDQDNKKGIPASAPLAPIYYFTIISRLYQGSIDSISGCIRILRCLECLDQTSKRFVSKLISSLTQVDSFIYEFKFMHDQKILSCRPVSSLNGGVADRATKVFTQAVFSKAKKYGVTTGYWDEIFYLQMETAAPNREILSSSLTQVHNGKLLSSSVNERSSYEDSNKNCFLVERWSLQ